MSTRARTCLSTQVAGAPASAVAERTSSQPRSNESSFKKAAPALCALAALLAILLMTPACSAPAQNPDLAHAEQAERQGNNDQALALYQQAQRSCRAISSPRQRRQACAAAYLGHAELLESMDRTREAAQAYERIPRALPDDDATSALALYRAGHLYLRLSANAAQGPDADAKHAYTLLWQTVTHYPDEPPAADALKDVLRDGRRRNPKQLYDALASLIQPLARTRVADNLLYTMAQLAENDLDQPATALRHYDKIPIDYPSSGLRDDAWWHAARIARALDDPHGAARRLRALLATREVAIGGGSYLSVWHDNAQLTLGLILRDDLHDPQAALAAFAQLPRDYPASILRDDALWETARTWDQLDDQGRTCAALARLQEEFPDSRYELTQAPELRRKHACQPAPP